MNEIKVVKVEWIDSCTSNLNWELLDDVTGDIEPIKIVSYGVFIQETEDCITIAQNYGTSPLQCCNLTTIPKGCIKQITDIDTIEIKD